MIKISLLITGLFFLVLLFTYSKTTVQFVCANTASTKGYTLYYGMIKKGPYEKVHWIEKRGRELLGDDKVKNNWIQTAGTKRTLLGTLYSGQSAPVIYELININIEQAKFLYKIGDVDAFVLSVIEGSDDERKAILLHPMDP